MKCDELLEDHKEAGGRINHDFVLDRGFSNEESNPYGGKIHSEDELNKELDDTKTGDKEQDDALDRLKFKESKYTLYAEESISHDKCPECNFETSWKEGDTWQEKDAEMEMEDHLENAHKGHSMLDPYANEESKLEKHTKELRKGGWKPVQSSDDEKEWWDNIGSKINIKEGGPGSGRQSEQIGLGNQEQRGSDTGAGKFMQKYPMTEEAPEENKCENCEREEDFLNDDGFCEDCEREAGIDRMESMRDAYEFKPERQGKRVKIIGGKHPDFIGKTGKISGVSVFDDTGVMVRVDDVHNEYQSIDLDTVDVEFLDGEKFKSRDQQQWYNATDQTYLDDEPHENRKVEGEEHAWQCDVCGKHLVDGKAADQHQKETGHYDMGFTATLSGDTKFDKLAEGYSSISKILNEADFKEEDHPRDDDGKFGSGGGGSKSGDSGGKHSDKSEKDLVKAIKGGSKDWKDWERNEKTEELYAEIEKRNQEVPKPSNKYPKVFRDDPDAVSKMEQKIKVIEEQQAYWKKIIKFPHRDYQNHSQLGDAKWYEMSLTSTKLREAKKKLEGIKAQQDRGTTLTRNPTYKGGRKNFYYKEEPKEEPRKHPDPRDEGKDFRVSSKGEKHDQSIAGGDIVAFSDPFADGEDERSSRFTVLEDREDRVLVQKIGDDKKYKFPPTSVMSKSHFINANKDSPELEKAMGESYSNIINILNEADFKEEDHPRDKGKFTSKGGGSSGGKGLDDSHKKTLDRFFDNNRHGMPKFDSVRNAGKDWNMSKDLTPAQVTQLKGVNKSEILSYLQTRIGSKDKWHKGADTRTKKAEKDWKERKEQEKINTSNAERKEKEQGKRLATRSKKLEDSPKLKTGLGGELDKFNKPQKQRLLDLAKRRMNDNGLDGYSQEEQDMYEVMRDYGDIGDFSDKEVTRILDLATRRMKDSGVDQYDKKDQRLYSKAIDTFGKTNKKFGILGYESHAKERGTDYTRTIDVWGQIGQQQREDIIEWAGIETGTLKPEWSDDLIQKYDLNRLFDNGRLDDTEKKYYADRDYADKITDMSRKGIYELEGSLKNAVIQRLGQLGESYASEKTTPRQWWEEEGWKEQDLFPWGGKPATNYSSNWNTLNDTEQQDITDRFNAMDEEDPTIFESKQSKYKLYEVDEKWECLDCNQKFNDAGKHQEETGHHNITKYHGEVSLTPKEDYDLGMSELEGKIDWEWNKLPMTQRKQLALDAGVDEEWAQKMSRKQDWQDANYGTDMHPMYGDKVLDLMRSRGIVHEAIYETLWDLWHGKDHFTTGMTGDDKINMVLASGLKFDDPLSVVYMDREDLPQELQNYLKSAPASTISGRPFDAEAKPKTKNLSQVIDDLNEKNAPPGGWDEEDKVAEEDMTFYDKKGNVVSNIPDEPEWMEDMSPIDKVLSMADPKDHDKVLGLIDKLSKYESIIREGGPGSGPVNDDDYTSKMLGFKVRSQKDEDNLKGGKMTGHWGDKPSSTVGAGPPFETYPEDSDYSGEKEDWKPHRDVDYGRNKPVKLEDEESVDDPEDIAVLDRLLKNEEEQQEKGEDEEEDIALIAQLLDPEAGESKKKAIENNIWQSAGIDLNCPVCGLDFNSGRMMGDHLIVEHAWEDSDFEQFEEGRAQETEQKVSPNTLLRDTDPLALPTGKNALDQTYGTSEPETPDGQDLTGKTIRRESYASEFLYEQEDIDEMTDDELIAKLGNDYDGWNSTGYGGDQLMQLRKEIKKRGIKGGVYGESYESITKILTGEYDEDEIYDSVLGGYTRRDEKDAVFDSYYKDIEDQKHREEAERRARDKEYEDQKKKEEDDYRRERNPPSGNVRYDWGRHNRELHQYGYGQGY